MEECFDGFERPVDARVTVDMIKQWLRAAVNNLQKLNCSRLVLALGQDGNKDVLWAQTFCSSVLEFNAPTMKTQQSFSECASRL